MKTLQLLFFLAFSIPLFSQSKTSFIKLDDFGVVAFLDPGSIIEFTSEDVYVNQVKLQRRGAVSFTTKYMVYSAAFPSDNGSVDVKIYWSFNSVDCLIDWGNNTFEKFYIKEISKANLESVKNNAIKEQTLKEQKRKEEELRIVEENRKQQVLRDSIVKIKSNAEQKFQNKEYDQAVLLYEDILKLDSSNASARQKINEINELLIFLNERKVKTYNFSQLENVNFKNNVKLLQEDLVKYMNPFDNGDLILDFHYSFDTLGLNRSVYKIEGSNSNTYRPQFDNVLKQFLLPSPSKYGYFVNATTDNKYNISWESDEKLFRYTSKGITQLKGESTEDVLFQNYITKLNSYGDYSIKCKSVKINNDTFLNAKVSFYKTKAGPANVFYSLFLPGIGSKKVTYGEKGTGRFVTFIISSALAYGMNSYSNKKYDLYMNTMGEESLKFYDQANKANKIFLTSFGLATSIYIYDVFYVIGKGVKNKKNQKEINSKIPNLNTIVQDNIILK